MPLNLYFCFEKVNYNGRIKEGEGEQNTSRSVSTLFKGLTSSLRLSGIILFRMSLSVSIQDLVIYKLELTFISSRCDAHLDQYLPCFYPGHWFVRKSKSTQWPATTQVWQQNSEYARTKSLLRTSKQRNTK